MAEPPASEMLEKSGEKLLPEADLLYSSNTLLEKSTKTYKANLVQWIKNVQKGWKKNAEVYHKISETHNFDLWIGDEPYDIMIAMINNPNLKKNPFIVIYDVLGIDTNTWNPIDHLVANMTNKLWLKFLTSKPPLADLSLFVGEIEDVPDKNFGFRLPNRRKLAEKTIKFIGYILPEDIKNFRDKTYARKYLNCPDLPKIVCSIGGTSAGKDLLNLCIEAYPEIKKNIPNLQMTIICGPRLPTNSLKAPNGVKILGYVPDLYQHLGAADLCIVTGGGTITLELTALRRPFLYFPLKNHFEQELQVASRCKRHNAGVRMDFTKTTPTSLAATVLSTYNERINYAQIPINGAQNSAQQINQILNEKT